MTKSSALSLNVNIMFEDDQRFEYMIRRRSQLGFLLEMEIAAGLIAYTFQPKKPSLNLRDNDIAIFKRS
ncbi:hypothetical protein PSI21_15330 [Xenorhabdus griffiniae]|nr:hypothetical protein [Xenorhabdus griffiniae]MDC9606332.1 hypothetical protein [Xenorhabdus griffiniae]